MKITLFATILIITALLAGCVNEIPDLPDEVPERQTSLEISTEPDATVYLDGEEQGTTDSLGNLRLVNLRPGGYDLLIEADGFYDYEDLMALSEFRANSVEAMLYETDEYVQTLSFRVYLSGADAADVGTVLRLEAEDGTQYVCDSSDFAVDPDQSLSGFGTYYGAPVQSGCEFEYVPRESYTLTVQADGYQTYSQVYDLSAAYMMSRAELYRSVSLQRDWAAMVDELSLSPGGCELLTEQGISETVDFECANVSVYPVDSRNQTHTYYTPDGYETEVVSIDTYHVEMLITNTGDSQISLSSYRAEGPTVSPYTGSNDNLYLADMSTGWVEPGETVRWGGYYVDRTGSEAFTPSYLQFSAREGTNSRYAGGSLIGFEAYTSDEYLGLELGAGECSVQVITESEDLNATSWYECITAFQDGNVALTELAEDECTLRPVYAGVRELTNGPFVYREQLSCEQVLYEPELRTYCYERSYSVPFTCEEADLTTLASLELEQLSLEMANRFTTDIDVVGVRVYDGYRWAGSADEPCYESSIDTSIIYGGLESIDLEFDSCSDDTEVTYKQFTVVFDLLVDGEPEEASLMIRSNDWNE